MLKIMSCLRQLNLGPLNDKRSITLEMTYLWYFCFGHICYDRIQRLTKAGPLRELTQGDLPICESSLEGRMPKRPFSVIRERAKEPLGLVCSKVQRQMNVQVRGGYEYFVTFIDDCSRDSCKYLKHRNSKNLLRSSKNSLLWL